MNREKIYCGKKSRVPSSYHRRGTRYECLKKGYGCCLGLGKKGSKTSHLHSYPRLLTYCGKNDILPSNYDIFGTNYECLKKGFGKCLYN
jgi:hypothetical protein